MGDERRRSFTQMLDELKECKWYWGAITPSMANRLLKGRPAGTFLVRDSRSDKSIFSFSFTTQDGLYHTRINCFNGKFCLGGPKSLIRSQSLSEFVEQIIITCSPASTETGHPDPDHSGYSLTNEDIDNEQRPLRVLMHPSLFLHPTAEPIDIRFLILLFKTTNFSYPLCRNQFPSSLRGACRLTIRRSISDISQIDSLPLPKKLKKYLAAPDYLLTF